MRNAVLDAFDKEMAELKADIQRNPEPRVARLAQLEKLRSEYLATQPVKQETAKVVPAAKKPPSGLLFEEVRVARPMVFTRRAAPERVAALKVAREYLAGRTEPVKTSEIHDYVLRKGVKLGGDKPADNLSAMMSKHPAFRSHGRAGWTLANREAAA